MKPAARILTALFALLFALSLFGCAKPSAGLSAQKPDDTAEPTEVTAPETPEATEAPTQPPVKEVPQLGSYKEAYAFYVDGLAEALTKAIDENLMSLNDKLRAEDPDGYFDDPAYYYDFFMPFDTMLMALTAELEDGIEADAVISAYEQEGYEQIAYTLKAPGRYEITYQDEQENGNVIEYTDLAAFENGALSFAHVSEGKTEQFYQFADLGGCRYAIESSTARAVVTYTDGEIINALLSETRFETELETNRLVSWSVFYDREEDSIIGKPALDEAWVLEKDAEGGLHRVYRIDEDGSFTYSGYSQTGVGEEAVFEPFGPVVLKAE